MFTSSFVFLSYFHTINFSSMRAFIFFLAGLISATYANAQTTYIDSLQKLRDHHFRELTDPSQQILNEEEKQRIRSLDYFPIDSSKKVQAELTVQKGTPFQLPTSSGASKKYRKYGYITFEWEGETVQLNIYQDIYLSKRTGFEDYLIIPFKDATSGKETYGGGRYLDFLMTNDTMVEVDFNTAYNPYCVYSYRYNCPVPPEENHLKVSIDAGEKMPVEHER